MGESALAMNCFTWARENSRHALRIMVSTMLLGAVLTLAGESFAYLTRPPVPVLAPGDSLRVVSFPDGGHLIKAHYLSARSVYCTRQTAELASTENGEWDGRKMTGYSSLAFNQNGPGMYFGTSDEYVLYRYIPPGVPDGPWQYIFRVRHECAPWGLIHWTYTAPPNVIDLPPWSPNK